MPARERNQTPGHLPAPAFGGAAVVCQDSAQKMMPSPILFGMNHDMDRSSEQDATSGARHSDDEGLVAEALRDSGAFERITHRYYYMVFSVAYAHLRDPEASEELAQETFVRAFLHLDKLRHHRTLPAWLNRIARNEALQWILKNQTRSRLLPTIPLEAVPMNRADHRVPSPRERAEVESDKAAIQRALSALPPEDREIVVMHFLEDVHKSEIARRLGVHPSSVGRALNRALGMLRKEALLRELRDVAPHSGASARAGAVVALVAALSAGNRAALAASCANTGVLASTIVVGASHGTWFGGLTAATAAKIAVAVASLAVVVGSVVGLHSYQKKSGAITRTLVHARTSPNLRGPEKRVTAPSAVARVESAAKSRSRKATAQVASSAAPSTGPITTLASVDADYLEGTVVDTEGNPIAYARAQVQFKEGETNESGRFRISGLRKTGFEDLYICKGGYSPFYEPRQSLGSMTAPVILGTRTAIEGVVTSENGVLLSGVSVTAAMKEHLIGDGHASSGDRFDKCVTDQGGRYRIPLAPQNYTVTARQGDCSAFQDVTLGSDNVCRVDLQLHQGNVFRALILDSLTSQPVSGVYAGLYMKASGGFSNTSGVVELSGLVDSDNVRTISFRKEGYSRFSSDEASEQWAHSLSRIRGNEGIPWLPFEVTSGVLSVTVLAEPSARIHGVVVDPANAPVANATVTMMEDAPSQLDGGLLGPYDATTDANGRFEKYLPASKDVPFHLVAWDTDMNHRQSRRKWADGRTDELRTQPGQDLDAGVIRLSNPARIRGVVRDLITSGPRTVTCVQADYPGLKRLMTVPECRIGPGGDFDLKFVPKGTIALRLVHWMDAGNSVGVSPVSPGTISLAEGETTSGVVLTEDNRKTPVE